MKRVYSAFHLPPHQKSWTFPTVGTRMIKYRTWRGVDRICWADRATCMTAGRLADIGAGLDVLLCTCWRVHAQGRRCSVPCSACAYVTHLRHCCQCFRAWVAEIVALAEAWGRCLWHFGSLEGETHRGRHRIQV